MTKHELADALRASLRNANGVTDDIRFAVASLTKQERGKLVAVCGALGYHLVPYMPDSESLIYHAQAREDARARSEGRHPRLITTVSEIPD